MSNAEPDAVGSEEPLAQSRGEDPARAAGKGSSDADLVELVRLAQRAFNERRLGDCMNLISTIVEIDPRHREALELQSWIRSNLQEDLRNVRALLERENPRVRQERAQVLLSRILEVDADNVEANALLLEVASNLSVSADAFANFTPKTPADGTEEKTEDIAPKIPFSDYAPASTPARPESRKPRSFLPAILLGANLVVLALILVGGAMRFGGPVLESVGLGSGVDTPTVQDQFEVPGEPQGGPSVPGSFGRLDLVVIPGTGVELSVDGAAFAPLPPYVDLSPGPHALEFRSAGFEPHTTFTEVSVGEQRIVAVVLDPSAPAGDLPSATAEVTPPPAPPRVENPAPPPPPPPREVVVQINARPWAEVFLDGAEMVSLGQTPLGNVRVPAGSVLVFRNPAFPDKRYQVAASDVTIQIAFP